MMNSLGSGEFAQKVRIADFHSHILPEMDDGSRSLDETNVMIRACVQQGVSAVALTPHFYADRDNPVSFLKRREKSYASLQTLEISRKIRFVLGAEVLFFEGLGQMEELSQLTLGSTNTLLLEMPFRAWSDRIVDDLFRLADTGKFRIVLAHIERYFPYMRKGMIPELIENGICIQSNAGPYLRFRDRFSLMKLMKKGQIHVLGSDTHNMTSRVPCLGPAISVIGKSLGDEVPERLYKNSILLMGLKND